MPLIQLLVLLVLFGVGIYLLDMIPMDGTIKQIIRVVAIVIVVLWVVTALGLLDLGPVVSFRRG